MWSDGSHVRCGLQDLVVSLGLRSMKNWTESSDVLDREESHGGKTRRQPEK